MKILVLILLSSLSFANSNYLEFDNTKKRNKKIKASKWLIDFGVRYINYPVQMAAYQAVHGKIDTEEKFRTYSVFLGFGREFYLGGGLSISGKLGAFYSSNTYSVSGQAAEDIDYEVSTEDSTYKIWSPEAGASLNYLFERKSIHIQPFIDLAFGNGKADFEKHYSHKDTTGASSGGYEAASYDAQIEDEFFYTRVGLGVNFITNYNISSYLRYSITSQDVTSRVASFEKDDQAGASSLTAPNPLDKQTIHSASLGMLYRF